MFAQYKLTNSKIVLKLLGSEYTVSFPGDDLSNEECKIYQSWLAEGNTPDSADAVVVPPVYISVDTFMSRLTDAEAESLYAVLTAKQKIRFSRLQDGIAIDDAEVTALLTSLNVDPKKILY